MPDRIYVKPVGSTKFPFPGSRDRMVRPGGEWVPAVSYFLRGIRRGELERVDPPKTKKAKAKKD